MAGMTPSWCRVFSTPDLALAEILHGMLVELGIDCMVVNRQDSVYVLLGEIELHVPCAQADTAADRIRDVLDQQHSSE
jgi:hypothetical protein